MFEKKTLVDQIEITRDGTIQVRFAVLVLEDGNEIASSWHRTSFAPGADIDAQMEVINAHLTKMGKVPVEAHLLNTLKSIVKVVHTPEAVALHKSRQAFAQALPVMPGKP